MSKQSGGQTSAAIAHQHWEALLSQSPVPELPALPPLGETRNGSRALLFRDLGYTFWNQELLDRLAARIRACGTLRWVELAAGTGRLTVELLRRGVPAVATDDYSQHANRVRGSQRTIQYGQWVHRISARDAVARLRPEAVLCAWPPLGSCLVPDLLARTLEGSESVKLLICIGEPGGATEAPLHPYEVPDGWTLETWPECETALVGFNDPPGALRSNSRLVVYRSDTAIETDPHNE
jgi:hypothetical protein